MEKIKETVEHILNANLTYEVNEQALQEIMTTWQENKAKFVDMFEGQLIYKSPSKITIDRTANELEIIFIDFLSELNLYRFYESLGNVGELRAFLQAQGEDAFFKNEVIINYTLPNNKEVPAGMKISRALKFFIYDKDLLHRVQSRYSMILQDIQLTGYLHISVHPLDYLSLSENTYNWHSCHALDGEYAGGNLNYMTDGVTVVAYLASEKQQLLPRFDTVEWNSKKWRAVMYVGDAFTIVGKGYPFKSEHLSQMSLDMLNNLRNGADRWTPIETVESKAEARDFVVDCQHSLHFNDVLLSSTHRGYVSYNEDWRPLGSDGPLVVGRDYPCLNCGSEPAAISDEYTCRGCCNYGLCVCCDEPVYDGEEYWFADEIYCEYCYYEYIVTCSCCDEEDHIDGDNVIWRDDVEEYYCEECYQEVLAEQNCEEDY